jgi:hypothetical protein
MVDTTVQNRLKRQRRAVLIFLYVAVLLSGLLDGFTAVSLPRAPHPDFAVRIKLLEGLLLSLGFLWLCTVDARLLGRPLIEMARLGIFLGWPVGVPIYLVWAHGLRGVAALLLHGFLLIVVWWASALALATALHLYGRF